MSPPPPSDDNSVERRLDMARELAEMRTTLRHVSMIVDDMKKQQASVQSELNTWRTVRNVGGWLLGIVSLVAGTATLKYFGL